MSKNHFFFLLSQFINVCGDQIFLVGLGLLTWTKTSSSFDVGLIYGLSYLGSLLAFLIMPLLTKYHTRKIMQTSNVVSVFFVTSFLSIENFYLQLISVFFYGLARAINKPLVQSFISHLSENHLELKRLNADYQISIIIASGLGLALLGIVNTYNNISPFYITIACFSLCGILTYFIKSKQIVKQNMLSYKTILIQALTLTKNNKTIFSIAILSSCVFAIIINFNNQLIPFTSLHGYSFIQYMVAEIVMTIALLFTGIFIRQKASFKISEEKIFALGWTVTGLCYMLTPFIANNFYLLVIILAILAIGDGFSNITQRIILGKICDKHLFESIFAFRFLMRDIFKAAIAFLLGYSIQNFGIDVSIFCLGLMAFCIMIYIFCFGLTKEN